MKRQHYIFIIVFLTVFSLNGCLRSIPYSEENEFLRAFQKRESNVVLAYKTDKGRQVAFYIPPEVDPQKFPARLVLLYPGIDTLALEWLKFIDPAPDQNIGFLLIDYPGRGYSEGRMHPEYLYKNSQGALESLALHFDVKTIDAGLYLLAHSFGSGAALQFAAKTRVKRIILIAPYNNLKEAVAVKLGKLIAWFMPAQIDNVALIKELLQKPQSPEIVIIHGSKDLSIPTEMGRELAAIDPARIEFHEIPGGSHVGILTSQRDLILERLIR